MSLVTYGYGATGGTTYALYGLGFSTPVNLPGICASIATGSMGAAVRLSALEASRAEANYGQTIMVAGLNTNKDVDPLSQNTKVDRCQ